MSNKLSQGEIGQIYKLALAPVLHKYENMEVIRITKDYHLLPDGTVFEEADLTFQHMGNQPLEEFHWHIPFISESSKVIGVRVKPNVSVRGFLSESHESYHLISIRLNPIPSGAYVHLQFEYFVCGDASFDRKIFENVINYPMAFVPAATVTSLDIRVHIPINSKYLADINLTKFIPITKSGEKVLLTSQEKDMVGDVSGNIVVSYKNSVYAAFVSVVAGLVFSATLLILPDFKSVLGIGWYPSVFGLTTLGIYGVYRAIKNIGS